MARRNKGLDKFNRRIKQMTDTAKEYENGEQVDYAELFDEEFMRKHTEYDSIQTFIEDSPFSIENQEDLEKVDDAEWDEWVRSKSEFNSWKEMGETAATRLIAKKMGF